MVPIMIKYKTSGLVVRKKSAVVFAEFNPETGWYTIPRTNIP